MILFLDSSALLVILTVLFTIMNGFFSLMETALNESRRSVPEKLADDGNADAALALEILSNPEKYLSVTQVGITSMSILSGLIAGLLLSPLLAPLFSFLPYSYEVALFVSVVLSAIFILLFGEFLPTKIALQYPEKTLMKYGGFLSAVSFVMSPAVNFLGRAADTVLLVLGMNPQIEDAVTEDEVKDLIEQGTSEGTFEKTEQDMVDRIFRLSDQTAYSLMTPRTQMLWLDLADSQRHNLRIIRENNQTVFPVGRESLDDFCGIIYAKEILNASLSSQSLELSRFVHKPMRVPRSMETFRLLEKFRATGVHEAMVLDEYGGVVGYVTLDHIMKEIIGGSLKELEPEFLQVTARDENSWYIDGLYSIDDFKTKFDIEKLPDEDRDHFQTLGGFVTGRFGCIPKVGEVCQWEDFRFEIIEMDRARIGKVLVSRVANTKKNETPTQ